MTYVHDRYSRTFEAMREEFTVINWRALTALNVDGYVHPRPGALILALGDPHDLNRVKPPYHIAAADDVQDALAAQVRPADPALAAMADKGPRWFRVVYAQPGQSADALLAETRAHWDELAAQHSAEGHGHGHGSAAAAEGAPALEPRGQYDPPQ